MLAHDVDPLDEPGPAVLTVADVSAFMSLPRGVDGQKLLLRVPRAVVRAVPADAADRPELLPAGPARWNVRHATEDSMEGLAHRRRVIEYPVPFYLKRQ